jgi:hypothetical protein
VQRGQRLDRHLGRAGDLDDPLAEVARRRRDRDKELVGAALANELGQVRSRPEHTDAVQAEVLLARVVVDETDGRVAERRVAEHLSEDQLGGVPRPHDEHLLAPRDDRPR